MENKQREQLGGNPDWMSRLPEELLDVPLWNLALPGSHDSMSFCLDVSSPVVRSESCFLRLTDRLFPCCTRPCVYRWATTQLSVLSDQCDLGVRFLDLRIARKPAGSSKLFFAHGIYTLITVKEALDELAGWLDAHPKEIVIIACSHFESLSDDDHAHLMEFILLLFRGKLCPPQFDSYVCVQETPTLRSCWSKGQQVIVSYDDQELQHPGLWNQIPYWYANSPDPKKVITYLEGQQRQGRPDGFYVTGLNLTESIFYVFLHPFQSMRRLTLNSLSLLLRWAGEQQPGPEGVNIMCCDFIGMSEFCSLVIELNYKLVDGGCRKPAASSKISAN
ncbi:unnamed protein product [Oreochromis niloticus]|nr:unnamed protein product [Mustela putorius furo]